MKCSVCARDVSADEYARHLATEHGVTDDPGAVLLEHLASAYPEREEREEREESAHVPEAFDVSALRPPEQTPRGGRRAIVVGFILVIALLATGVAYALTRGGGTKHVASRPRALTTTSVIVTTTVPAITAGPPETQVPVGREGPLVTEPPPAPSSPAAAPATPPAPDPKSQMVFAYSDASRCLNGQFDIRGSVTNHSSATYTIAFTITVFAADGSPAGSASTTAPHLAPGTGLSFGATGSCSQAISGRAPSTRITSITPG